MSGHSGQRFRPSEPGTIDCRKSEMNNKVYHTVGYWFWLLVVRNHRGRKRFHADRRIQGPQAPAIGHDFYSFCLVWIHRRPQPLA